jgi:gliding motility-associated-like protein
MRILPAYLKRIFLSTLLFFMCAEAFGNHLVGMDFFYTYVSGNTYKITLIAYADCASSSLASYGALSTNTPAIYIYNGDSYISTINLSVQPPSTGVEITPVCPADLALTQCTSLSYTIPGIKKFVYSANYTVSGPSPVWRFLFTGDMGGSYAGRSTAITNLSSSPVSSIQLVDTLDNSTGHNSNPTMSVVPTPYFCINNTDNYNPGAVDPDGDSLTFYLVDAMGGTSTSSPGGPVTYVHGSGVRPLQASVFSFDPMTGQISFYTDTIQRSCVVYNIEEHRAGTLVGTCQREMTFLLLTCTNTPASGGFVTPVNATVTDSTHLTVCAGSGAFSVNINPTESDVSNDITVTSAGLPTGATLSVTGNGTPTPHVTFSWSTSGLTPGAYTFYLTFTDNNCPLAGTQTLAYTITVSSQPTVSYSVLSAASCTKKGAITITPGGSGSPWQVDVSQTGDTLQRFPGTTRAFTDSLPGGTYTITIFSFGSHACSSSETITLTLPTLPALTPTTTNPTYCGASDGTIILHHLQPGTLDTVVYTFDGVVHRATYTVATDSSITITGLLAGVYTSITASEGAYCVSPAATATLVNPAFPLRTLTAVNPIFCGICNGSVTLYGLHPGQLDTINFTKDGVAQPQVSFLVGSDSEIILTGLCAGVYSSFIANTASVCISAPVGPVTLTVPPFTMRSITFTNPVYCGICDGTVTLHGLYPSGLDTIYYTMDGAAQTPVPVTVASDSTVTLTGLCAGVYDNFVAHAGASCISNTLGPVTLTVPPFTQRSLTFTNPAYCGICNGSVTIHGLHPGETDSVHYTYGGVAQTPWVQAVGTDSTITITGLCAGVYANFITHTGGTCVSNTLGPVTLTVPPFTIRAITNTNPDYCGICNGTITVYGAYPGQLDTFNFTKDGVAQTAVSFVIPSDSTVTITGLCAGTYDNIIANTAGSCISNSLGPVDLTVPPFVVRTDTTRNPTKCGFCDGIMWIFGVHPGETDSVHYFLNGVLQPPYVALVSSDSIIAIPGLCEGTYTNITVTTGGVCVSNVLGPDTLKAPPIIPAFNYNIGLGCKGDTLYTSNQSWPASDLTYIWNFGDGTSVSTATDPTHVYYSPGTYNVELYITNTKCYDSITHSFTLDNLINAGYTATPYPYVCQETPVTFTNTSVGTSLSYTWIYGDEDVDHTANTVHSFVRTGTYNVQMVVSNYVPCYDTVIKTIEVDSISGISMSATDNSICQGTGVTVEGVYSLIGNTGVVWSFGPGDTLKNVNPVLRVYDQPGEYTITVQALYRACPDTSVSRTFVVYSNPPIDLGADTAICPGSNAISIGNRAQEQVGASWEWNTGQTTQQISIIEPGDYYAKVTLNGCSSVDTIHVYNDCYIDIPNVFTPNGDGLNDYFFPRQLLARGLSTFSIQIYNRWGELVFSSNTLDGRGWDGRFNGVPQPEGVYIYILDATFIDGEHEHRKGNVSLLR